MIFIRYLASTLLPDPLEPNIIAFKATPSMASPTGPGNPQSVLIRLAHGYNMPDCMHIKHYKVFPFSPNNRPDPAGLLSNSHSPTTNNQQFPRQTWKLVSPINDKSIWITSMLNGGDFAPVDMDIRSMAFPKVGTPDDPSWKPTGLSMKSLGRPLYNFKRMLRSRWNGSRCDLLTFLRLRRPVYMSDDVLTLVSTVVIPPANDADPTRINANLLNHQQQVHAGMVRELMVYREGLPADHAD